MPNSLSQPLQRARAALAVAIAAGIPFALLGLAGTLTPDGHHFRHTADYWYTALGIAWMVSAIVLVASVHAVQNGKDGRVGRVGALVACAGLALIVPQLVYALAAGTSSGLGPAYPIAAFAADIGMILFSIGAWRAGFLPRPLAVAWLFAFLLGGAIGPVFGPVLLVAVYALLLARLSSSPITSPASPGLKS